MNTKTNIDTALRMLQQRSDQHWWGTISVVLHAGKVVLIKEEHTIKPGAIDHNSNGEKETR